MGENYFYVNSGSVDVDIFDLNGLKVDKLDIKHNKFLDLLELDGRFVICSTTERDLFIFGAKPPFRMVFHMKSK